MTKIHSLLGASGLYRWGECPGSVELSKGLPPKTNEYAELGTLAHSVGEEIFLGTLSETMARFLYDAELVDAVMVYVNYLRSRQVSGAQVKVEHAFDLTSLYGGLFGTCDAVLYETSSRHLEIVDYKHGSGHFVEVENNQQLLYYALGALMTFQVPVREATLTIVQPRCPRRGKVIHHWKTNPATLVEFMMELVLKAKATEVPNAQLKEGSWCYFCPAVGICPAQHEKRMGKAIEQFKAFKGDSIG